MGKEVSVKVTNKQLFDLKSSIQRVKELGSNSFKLPLILNEMKIDERIRALEELRKPSKKMQEYEEKRRQLFSKHAELDGSGQLVLYSEPDGKGERRQDFGIPNIVNEKEAFEEANKELLDEYKEELEKAKKKQEEFQETLSQEAEIKLQRIPFDVLPEVKYEDMKVLLPIIEN